MLPIKPGWQTTEFWLTLATSIISLLLAFNVIHVTSSQTQEIMGVLGLIVPNAIYGFTRGQVKAAALTAATSVAAVPGTGPAPPSPP